MNLDRIAKYMKIQILEMQHVLDIKALHISMFYQWSLVTKLKNNFQMHSIH